jgi:hypothetical protein
MQELVAKNSGNLTPDLYVFLSNYFKCKAYIHSITPQGLQSFPGEVYCTMQTVSRENYTFSTVDELSGKASSKILWHYTE